MENMQMKNSGIDWIGDIPYHWDVVRLKDIAKINKGSIFDDKLASVDGIYPYINGGIKPSDWSNYFNSNENTIAVSEGGASAGYTQFMKNKYWAGSHCYKIQSKNKNIDNKYIYYILKGFEQYLMIEKTGSAMPNLQKTKFVNYVVSFINNVEEQNKIVNYLDIETSKIDRKISILEQKHQKLEEYKQSVIFETVTKGLDSNVPMKDSGIDWIGDIPSHWEVKRVKDLFLLKKGKNAGTYSADFIHDEENKGEYPVYSGQTENEGVMGSIKTFEYNYLNGVLFTTTVGAKAMSVKRLFNSFSLSQNCGLLVPTKTINLSYSYYLISSCFSFARQSIPSHMQPSLRKEDLNIFYCLDIPLNEQESIGVYLDALSSKFDKKKEIIKKQINLLKEYKQTIIYEAVTGKMEIL